MDKVLDVITALSPIGVAVLPAYMGYLSKKAEKLAKSQYDDIKSTVNQIQSGVDDNKSTIGEVVETIKVHGESHLNIMSFRLEKEINQALEDGYTTSQSYKMIEAMHNNYKALGGNGYIDRLYEQYLALEMRR